jgi:hypothetical protein
MTPMVLRLYEDRLPSAGEPVYLPALERALYLIDGEVTVEFADGCANQMAGSAWLGGGPIALLPGAGGARLLRWELASASSGDHGALRSAPSAHSEMKLAAEIELDADFGWLMRCDRVAFPKGGIAHAHVHQGPGIRYCLEGAIDIESEGRTHRYGPGEAWFERGPTPVVAPTSKETETSFVRCFVLPRGCKGRSSIRYVHLEDAAKPKLQRYKVLGERSVELAGRGAP